MTIIPRTNQICSVTNVDFSPDGKQLLITSESNLAIWDLTTGQRLQSLIMEGTAFEHAFWSPDGSTVLDLDLTAVDILNPANLGANHGGFIAPGRLEGKFLTYSVWSPDGKTIASSTSDGKIYIWYADNRNILRIFTEHTVSVERLVWNSALSLIASGDDSGKILVWNPTTGEVVAELNGHSGVIRDLDWRADGQQLASTGADNSVRTWAWPSGEMQIVENDQSIWSVAYSPDGSQLAYGGELNDPQDIVSHIIITSIINSPPLLTPTATATN